MVIITFLQIMSAGKNAGEGVKRREHSYTVGGNIIWGNHYRGTVKN